MKRRIELFMPVMRPESALSVMCDLKNQTRLIDKLTIVDNGLDFELICDLPFEVEIIRPESNIGTNAVWNMMWLSKYDIVGIIGDDYELEDMVIEGLERAIDQFPEAGGFTAKIYRNKPIEIKDHTEITGGKIVGRGRCGVTLFKRSTLDEFPKIPEELFVFFGDNWIGYWLNVRLKKPLYEVSVGVSHYHSVDLKKRLNYPAILERDTSLWRQWKTGNIKLGGISHE